MVGVERFAKRLPAALIALIVGIAISRIFDLAGMGVEVVEEIPVASWDRRSPTSA